MSATQIITREFLHTTRTTQLAELSNVYATNDEEETPLHMLLCYSSGGASRLSKLDTWW